MSSGSNKNAALLFPANANLPDLEKTIQEIKNRVNTVKKSHPEFDDDDWDRYGFRSASVATPGWKVITSIVKAESASRRESMLGGPMFSSENFPWPSKRKKPMLSVVQMDLRIASKLRCLPFGDGLLQVFISECASWWEVRVVPRQEVDTANLAALPEFENIESACVPMDWITGNDISFRFSLKEVPDGRYFEQIVGFDEPVISSCAYGVSDLVKPDGVPQDVFDVARDLALIHGNIHGLHMFGTFDGIQYRPDERKPLFMAFCDDHGYTFGGGGNAQIFYKSTKNGPKFEFEWSCG